LDDAKVRDFCHHYLFKTNCNATEAYLAIQPGVTRASASVLGSRLLGRVRTQELLAEIAAGAAQRNKLDEDYIIGCWIAMSRANVFDYLIEARCSAT
jgi:hypothetical protein